MEIIIESVTTDENEGAMLRIRQEVFQREMGIEPGRLTVPDSSRSFHLIARAGPVSDAVAALSVVDTSGNHNLHAGYRLTFPSSARVARYTQLAVLRPYRGLNIPLMLMLEAYRRYVARDRFDYTWLLFDSQRADSSLICKWLGFTPSESAFASEYGLSRTLLRDERAPQSEQAIWRTEQYVERMLKTHCAPDQVPESIVSVHSQQRIEAQN
jgi:hypothetical protein